MNAHIKTVALEKAYRLLTHGPTVLVSAQDENSTDVMAAAWACALEFKPAKVTVVLDKMTKTRQIIENSGYFALQIPNLKQLDLVYAVGNMSLHNTPEKLRQAGVELFQFEGHDTPVVLGCNAWLLCKLIPEPHNQHADERIFKEGHWEFSADAPEWKTLHHVAGGHFYTIGDAVSITLPDTSS